MRGSQSSFGRSLLKFLFVLVLLLSVYSWGCSQTTTQEKVDETPTTTQEKASEPTSQESNTTQESAPEPTPEKAVEPEVEKSTPEPVAEATDAGSATEPVTDTSDAGPGTPCTGIKPPYPDVVASAPPEVDLPETLPETLSPDEVCKYKPGQCIGSDVPVYKLTDFQPQSCGFKQAYSLQAFKGYVLVVALLSGW